MKLRSNPGIIVESSHANRHLRTVRPITAEQAGTAVCTERFHSAFAFAVNFDQLFALQWTELFLQHPRLRADGRPGMLAAAVAMTMIRLEEGRIDFKTHCTAQTAATDRFSHTGTLDRIRIAASWPFVSVVGHVSSPVQLPLNPKFHEHRAVHRVKSIRGYFAKTQRFVESLSPNH